MLTENPEKIKLTSPNSSEEQVKPSYRVLNFFKRQPGIAITCMSAVIVIITFLANTVIYVRESFYLNYWNIDAVYVSISAPNQFYKVCGNLIYALSMVFSIWIMNSSYEAYLPSKRLIISLNTLIRTCKKEVKRTNKVSKKSINSIRKSRRNNPGVRIKGEAQRMHGIEKLSKYSLTKIIDVQRHARKVKNTLRKEFFIHIFFVIVILTAGLLLFMLLGSCALLNFWEFLVAISVIFLMLFFICTILYGNQIDRKAIKKNAEEHLDKYVEELSDDTHEYPFKQDLLSKFSDTAIVSFLISATLYIVLLLVFSSILGHDEAKAKDSFPVLTQDDRTYAIVYTTGENAILEACEIHDDEIEIYTYIQKIISVEGIEYEIQEFKNIQKTDTHINPAG